MCLRRGGKRAAHEVNLGAEKTAPLCCRLLDYALGWGRRTWRWGRIPAQYYSNTKSNAFCSACCISGPDLRAPLALFGCIIFTFWIWAFLAIIPLLEIDAYAGKTLVFAICAAFVVAVSCFLLTVCSDPGIIPHGDEAATEESVMGNSSLFSETLY